MTTPEDLRAQARRARASADELRRLAALLDRSRARADPPRRATGPGSDRPPMRWPVRWRMPASSCERAAADAAARWPPTRRPATSSGPWRERRWR